jgi:hypothetical protein
VFITLAYVSNYATVNRIGMEPTHMLVEAGTALVLLLCGFIVAYSVTAFLKLLDDL